MERLHYLMVISAELLNVPAIETTRGYVPGGRLGTSAFTCIRPMNPGVKPANETFAGTPLIVAVTTPKVIESGADGAGAPVGTGLSSAPEPVK